MGDVDIKQTGSAHATAQVLKVFREKKDSGQPEKLTEADVKKLWTNSMDTFTKAAIASATIIEINEGEARKDASKKLSPTIALLGETTKLLQRLMNYLRINDGDGEITREEFLKLIEGGVQKHLLDEFDLPPTRAEMEAIIQRKPITYEEIHSSNATKIIQNIWDQRKELSPEDKPSRLYRDDVDVVVKSAERGVSRAEREGLDDGNIGIYKGTLALVKQFQRYMSDKESITEQEFKELVKGGLVKDAIDVDDFVSAKSK